MIQQPGNDAREDRGSALVMAVFVLALLTAMGAALLFYSENEKRMGEASIKPKKAFYYAEAGLEHARRALWIVNQAEDFDDDLQIATGWVPGTPLPLIPDPIGFDPETIAPIYDSNDNVIGFSGYDNDTPLIAVRQLDDGWYGAFMSNDHGEGRTNSVDTDNRVILAGVGVGPDRSFEVVEAVIDLDPITPEMAPAAIFMLGPTPAFASGTSKTKIYSGNDCGVGGGDYYPAVGAIGSAAEASAEAGANANPTYQAGPEGTPGGVIADMSAFPVQAMSDVTYTMSPEWTECKAMKDMVEAYREIADYTCADSTRLAHPTCPANVSSPKNVYFGEGDLDVSTLVPHRGTLVVTGDLSLSGAVDFDGLILVIGTGNFRFNGAGNGVVAGAMIIADIAGPDGVYGTDDDCTGGDNGFAPAVYDERGGGNAGNVYCSTVLDAVQKAHPYEIEQFRQH